MEPKHVYIFSCRESVDEKRSFCGNDDLQLFQLPLEVDGAPLNLRGKDVFDREGFPESSGSEKERIVLCVHGFADNGLSWYEELGRTFALSEEENELSFENNVRSTVVGLSWPSMEGGIKNMRDSYDVAKENASRASEFLVQILKFLRDEKKYAVIDIVAHSIGALVALNALKKEEAQSCYLVGATLSGDSLREGGKFDVGKIKAESLVITKSVHDLTLRFLFAIGESDQQGKEITDYTKLVFGAGSGIHRSVGNYGVSNRMRKNKKVSVLELTSSHYEYFKNEVLMSKLSGQILGDWEIPRKSEFTLILIRDLEIDLEDHFEKFTSLCSQLELAYQGPYWATLVFTGKLASDMSNESHRSLLKSIFGHLIEEGFSIVHTLRDDSVSPVPLISEDDEVVADRSADIDEIPLSSTYTRGGVRFTSVHEGEVLLVGVVEGEEIEMEHVEEELDDINSQRQGKVYMIPYFDRDMEDKEQTVGLVRMLKEKASSDKSLRLFKKSEYMSVSDPIERIKDYFIKRKLTSLHSPGDDSTFHGISSDELVEGRELTVKQPLFNFGRSSFFGRIKTIASFLVALFYLFYASSKQMIPIMGSLLLQFYFKVSYGICELNPPLMEPLDLLFFAVLVPTIFLYGVFDDYPSFKKRKRRSLDLIGRIPGLVLMVVDGSIDAVVMVIYILIQPPFTCWGLFHDYELEFSLYPRLALIALFFLKVVMVFTKQFFKWNVPFMKKNGCSKDTFGQKIRHIRKEIKRFGRAKEPNKQVYESTDISNLATPDQLKRVLKRLVPFYSIPMYFTILKVLSWMSLFGYGGGGSCSSTVQLGEKLIVHTTWFIVAAFCAIIFFNQIRISLVIYHNRRVLANSLIARARLVPYFFLLSLNPFLSVISFITFISYAAGGPDDFPCFDLAKSLKYVGFFSTIAVVTALGSLGAFLDRNVAKEYSKGSKSKRTLLKRK